MGGRLRICQEICTRTNAGDDTSYNVAIDQPHFRELLLSTTSPPVIRTTAAAQTQASNPASLLCMGFPSRVIEDSPTLCACHGNLTRGGYTCSRCAAKVCSLPSTCPSCHLTLILSTHLARSYHHLFPLRNWIEVPWSRAKAKGTTQCKGCLNPFPPLPAEYQTEGADTNGDVNMTNGEGAGAGGPVGGKKRNGQATKKSKPEGASESSRYECETCGNHFCIDCDVFCHEVVHNCPGCLSEMPEEEVGGGGENGMVVDGE